MKYLFLIITALFIGCDGAIESEYKQQIVVHGFIYPGEAIDSVVLHYTSPYGTAVDDNATSVTGADVRVLVDGKEFVLQPATLPGRYFLPRSEHIVEGGKVYELRIKKDQHSVRAVTRVPLPIEYTGLNDSLPDDRILVLDTINATTFRYGLTAGPIDEPTRLYMLYTTALDTTFGKIPTNQNGPPVDTSAYARYGFIQTAPNMRLYSRLFGWFGPNRITMLALDSNWVDYKRAVGYGGQAFISYQPSLNHVEGGIGVWASAGKDTVTVFIKPKN
jgi:hypothetical protein